MKKILFLILLALIASLGFVACDDLKDDDCPSSKYKLYNTYLNSWNTYAKDTCEKLATNGGYDCYSYDSTNKICYGYK